MPLCVVANRIISTSKSHGIPPDTSPAATGTKDIPCFTSSTGTIRFRSRGMPKARATSRMPVARNLTSFSAAWVFCAVSEKRADFQQPDRSSTKPPFGKPAGGFRLGRHQPSRTKSTNAKTAPDQTGLHGRTAYGGHPDTQGSQISGTHYLIRKTADRSSGCAPTLKPTSLPESY